MASGVLGHGSLYVEYVAWLATRDPMPCSSKRNSNRCFPCAIATGVLSAHASTSFQGCVQSSVSTQPRVVYWQSVPSHSALASAPPSGNQRPLSTSAATPIGGKFKPTKCCQSCYGSVANLLLEPVETTPANLDRASNERSRHEGGHPFSPRFQLVFWAFVSRSNFSPENPGKVSRESVLSPKNGHFQPYRIICRNKNTSSLWHPFMEMEKLCKGHFCTCRSSIHF